LCAAARLRRRHHAGSAASRRTGSRLLRERQGASPRPLRPDQEPGCQRCAAGDAGPSDRLGSDHAARAADSEGRDTVKIAILGGAGAMGSALGALLFEAGNDVTLVDVAQKAVEAIHADGLIIEGKDGTARTVRVPATTDPASIGPVELVIVFVKCYHTEAAV